MTAVITASSVLCAGGRGTEQLWATVRAGIGCVADSRIMDRHNEFIQMSLVPEDELESLQPEMDAAGLPGIARRMLRLAGPTLKAVAEAAGPSPLTIYLALPQRAAADAPWLVNFLKHLSAASGVAINFETSRTFPMGRAAAFAALDAALQQQSQDPSATIIVGGVDTFLDFKLVAALDLEARILGPKVMDGFIPGEGAAFFVLKDESVASNDAAGRKVFLKAASTVSDDGHRYGSKPATGEGLANAIDKLRAALPGKVSPVACTFAGFNGENFEAKLWGVARLRHTDFFRPDMVMQHPADCIGDMGAAAGAVLTALAAFAMASGQREGSALIWAAADHELRGCALLAI